MKVYDVHMIEMARIQKLLQEKQNIHDQTDRQKSYSSSPIRKNKQQQENNEPSNEIIDKLIQFYSDDGRMKKVQKVQKDKLYKHLTCCSFLPVISPDNTYVVIWKVCVMLLTIFYFYEIPIFVCFGWEIYNEVGITQNQMTLVFSVSLIIFSMDICINFVTAYFQHGNPILKHGKIALNYLKTDFYFDLITIIVIATRIFSDSEGPSRWIYFIIFLRLSAVLKTDDHLEEIFLLRRQLRLIHMILRILISLFCCINLYSCLFYDMGIHFYENFENTWLNNQGNFGIIGERPLYERYFFGFYYSVGTLTSTMGYGDITPQNIKECSYALMGVLFGILVFVFNMNNIFDYVGEYNDLNEGMVRDKIAIHRFLRDKKVSTTTKSRINQYLNEFWYFEGRRDFGAEQKVLDQLGPELKGQVLFEVYSPFLNSVPFFDNFSNQFIFQLSLNVKEIRLSKGETLLKDFKDIGSQNFNNEPAQIQTIVDSDPREDRRNDSQFPQINNVTGSVWVDQQCLYFIQLGSLKIHPRLEKNQIILGKLKEGQIFGEWSFLTGLPRQASVTTLQYVHLQYISRQDFLDTIQKFPQDYEIFCMLRDQMILNQKLNMNTIECFTCNQPGHMATKCPYSHYFPEIEDIEKEVQKANQTRKKFRRFARAKSLNSVFRYQQQIGFNKKQTSKLETINMSKSRNVGFKDSDPESDEYQQKFGQLKSLRQIHELESKKKQFNQLDEPKDYEYYYPYHNMNSFSQIYNVQKEEENSLTE